jgi:hypothetical protein
VNSGRAVARSGTWVALERRSPWKLTVELPGSSGGLSPLPSLGLKLLRLALPPDWKDQRLLLQR